MERALIWFKCAAAHDPVRPVVKQNAKIGWEAKERKVDLTIECSLKADDLLERMKGWFTADVRLAAKIFNQFGRLKILDDLDLVVETQDPQLMELLEKKLVDVFDQDVWVERIKREKMK